MSSNATSRTAAEIAPRLLEHLSGMPVILDHLTKPADLAFNAIEAPGEALLFLRWTLQVQPILPDIVTHRRLWRSVSAAVQRAIL